MQSVLILGRQPALGLAELEVLYGAQLLQPINGAALLDVDPDQIAFNRLGGSMKLARVLTTLPSTNWGDIENFLVKETPKHLQYLPDGKLQLGISAYGFDISPLRVGASGLSAKKAIKHAGRSVRLIPNKEAALNSAQVLNNKLTGPLGWELVFIKNGNQTIVGQTVAEQDIDAYAARDQARPMRDTRVGMLPPKLAQIIVNLSGVHQTALPPDAPAKMLGLPKNRAARILDPFCGTGVVLQEALLAGYDVVGSDLEPRMIEYTKENLEWLTKRASVRGSFALYEGDATSLQWELPIDGIAAETYLGRPFSVLPQPEILMDVMQDVNLIHKRFLQNVARQTSPGFRLSIAVPAWHTQNGFKHLKILDILPELGYNRISFVHVDTEDLIYHRTSQIVARELVILERK